MSEEKKGRERKAPTERERERQGGVHGERGRDKSEIPRERSQRNANRSRERGYNEEELKCDMMTVAVEAVKYE